MMNEKSKLVSNKVRKVRKIMKQTNSYEKV